MKSINGGAGLQIMFGAFPGSLTAKRSAAYLGRFWREPRP